MERKVFLSCQSYLLPLSSDSLPGNYDSSSPNDSGAKYSREVLLDNMNLSIEPCENTVYSVGTNNSRKDIDTSNASERNAGPAYFVTKKARTTNGSVHDEARKLNTGSDYSGMGGKDLDSVSDDPAVCKLQLSLYTCGIPPKGMTTPIKKAYRRDLSELEDHVMGNDETILVAKIDGNYFQVDLNRIQSIRVGQSEAKDDAGKPLDTSSTEQKQVSSFLILELPSCCFRIFTSKTSSTSENSVLGGESLSRGFDHDRTKLDAVRTRLVRLLSGDSLLPFPLSYSGLFTPASVQAHTSRKLPGRQNEGDPFASAHRSLHSYSQAWNDLMTFDEVLENTPQGASVGSSRAKQFKDTVNQLMSRIPNQVSSSFIEGDDLAKTLEMYERKITSTLEEFDGVIGSFWNEKAGGQKWRNNKRQRDNADYESRENDSIGRFVDILKDHRKHVRSKHDLFLLPSRG